MTFVEIVKYAWAALFGSKTFYGVSTDSSIELKDIPRKYPKINDKFKIYTETEFFKVIDVSEQDERITITREDNTRAFDVDIELFEELFIPVDEQFNYPL